MKQEMADFESIYFLSCISSKVLQVGQVLVKERGSRVYNIYNRI